ncbi:MAG: glycosyltransferase [Ferroplasma sp.]|uniref:glycosyltransferase n=1 Tax=Ferroplasma sp. TaxID=2591003 RepID=UPI002816867B|nr:glycosyltransferase [Ferroplasma sp.]WMT50625.1 MAG: glycosyltransferase [Ferroplasma sp.]
MEHGKNSGSSEKYETGISLIIPAYHEKNRIMQSLNKYIPVLESTGLKYEIIVVIDGEDGTQNILGGIKNLSYYKPVIRLGKGGAVKKGFSLAKYSYIGYIDADGSLDAKDFKNLLSSIKNNCCTIASRYLNNSKWINKEPLFNRISSRGFNLLVNAFFRLNVKDTQCGAKFFNKKIIDKILPAVTVRNRTFDVSILYHVKRSGFKISEMPVTWNHDNNSNMPIKAAIIPMFMTIVAIKLMNSRIKEYVPKFFYKVVSKFNFY